MTAYIVHIYAKALDAEPKESFTADTEQDAAALLESLAEAGESVFSIEPLLKFEQPNITEDLRYAAVSAPRELNERLRLLADDAIDVRRLLIAGVLDGDLPDDEASTITAELGLPDPAAELAWLDRCSWCSEVVPIIHRCAALTTESEQ